MYEIFRLPVPIVTGDFEEALHSVGKKLNVFHLIKSASLTAVNSEKVLLFLFGMCVSCWCLCHSDPSRFQDSWRLSDGFVAAEAKVILPHRARSRWDKSASYILGIFWVKCYIHVLLFSITRPDLMDNYLALLLSAFINSGLLEVYNHNITWWILDFL